MRRYGQALVRATLVFLLFTLPAVAATVTWAPVSEAYFPHWDEWGRGPEGSYGGDVANADGVYAAVMFADMSMEHYGDEFYPSTGASIVWNFATTLMLTGLEPGQSARVTVSTRLHGALHASALFGCGNDPDAEGWTGAAHDTSVQTSGAHFNNVSAQADLRRECQEGGSSDSHWVPFNEFDILLSEVPMTNGDTVTVFGQTSAWANAASRDTDIDAHTDATYAFAVSTQVVPIPAAGWLFGSVLGLLGWVRTIARR